MILFIQKTERATPLDQTAGGTVRRLGRIMLALGSLLPGAAVAQTIESTYSPLDLEADCIVMDQPAPDDPGAWVQLRCRGYDDYPIYVSDDDQRMSLDYGFVDSWGAWESFAGFNYVHDIVEWRLRDQTPFATIHRWFIADGAGGERQVLVISTVAPQGGGRLSCIVGLVDANANPEANVGARMVADNYAKDFRCGVDQPRYYGTTTSTTPRLSSTLG